MVSNQILNVNIPTPTGHLEGILKPEEEGSQPLYTSIVCFNFRGVGRSTGTYDEGRGETDDVRYALEFLSRRYPGTPIILAGFSFGAYVGLRVAVSDDRVQAMIGLGVPARWFEGNTLQGCHKPKLIIHGTEDDTAPYNATVQWFEQVPAPKSMVAIEGADHFFQGYLEEVQTIVKRFVQTL